MTANKRRTIVRRVAAALALLGALAAAARFARGLGMVTALSDAVPWGLWVGFDLLGGVALAAGGFIIAGVVYVMGREQYRPLLRPAILTALLGYGTVIVGLLCDLGLPWHIWKPLFNWQPHSPLFEVAMCVMFYTTVLMLEFSPIVLEHAWFQKPFFRGLLSLLHRLTLPLVIVGIVLSTLHQSSLGSLFLIMPLRVHPLWYSPILPLLFFASAIALGLAVLILEGFASASLFDHPLRLDLYDRLGRASAWALWLYLALRLGDLVLRGVLPSVANGSWQGGLFGVEIGIGGVLPALLLSLNRVRKVPRALAGAAGLVTAGVLLNRLSISLITIYRPPTASYFPTWMEFAITVGILAAAVLAFIVLTENLKILDERPVKARPQVARYARPVLDPVTRTCLGRSLPEVVGRWSLGLVALAAVAVVLLPREVFSGPALPPAPVQSALGWDMLWIDGDRDGYGVAFDHLAHWERLKDIGPGDGEVCVECHHLSMPGDQWSACSECHSDMHLPTEIFDHRLHQGRLGGNDSCGECHLGAHTASSAKPCTACHEDLKIEARHALTASDFTAPGYQDALHGTCLVCHETQAVALEEPALGLCSTCHEEAP